ncbi:hypothetical protein WN51_14685 [Melipona quadrifasciata]|uniref:Fatty acyl-CoA reductase n=1 Tax=Melipona quadrifasciata TaxID=166423 RepID=A0A0M9A0N4_9HYME|nr:hypothetical protein WN51_14685 [Melipona quadrifasciata]
MDETNTEINKKLNQTNSIEEFYATAVILLTGATGFVGKALLEKLMHVCPRIAAIFILLRPKRNQTIEQRFKKLIDDPVHLGLSLEDRIVLIEEVNIVFHAAATASFKQPLAVAVNINAKGTSRIIDLCKELKHVICFIHVSTAYSNAHLPEIEEKVYTKVFLQILHYCVKIYNLQLVRNTVRQVSLLLIINFAAQVRNLLR